MKFDPVQIVTSGDMSADVTSKGVFLDQLALYSIQAVWSGSSPTGTFKLQVSNDYVPVSQTNSDPANAVTSWTDYTASSYAITANGDYMWNVTVAGYCWVRLKYTFTSGTGTLNAKFFGKG
jgi:hypothetical protein